MSDFQGGQRHHSMVFAVQGKGYVCAGLNGSSYYNDHYQFDPDSNSWAQMASFPGNAREFGVSFASDSSGFVGLGWDGGGTFSDFYRYNPISDTWDSLTAYPGKGKRGAVGTSLNGKGYVGGGGGGSSGRNGLVENDFWEYDMLADSWTQKASFPFSARTGAIAFAIDSMVYVGLGHNHSSSFKDLWAYNPTTNSWTQKTDLPGLPRMNAMVFVLNGKAIVGGGHRIGMGTAGSLGDYYEYDPASDSWKSINSFSKGKRTRAKGFAVNGYGYLVCGTDSSGVNYQDTWKYSDSSSAVSCNASFSSLVDSTNTVLFNAHAVGIGNKYNWDFGDGLSDTVSNPAHSYSTSGTYLVSLTLITPVGDTCTSTDSILVNTCSANYSYLIGKGGEVSFFSHANASAFGTSYSWTFGDGSISS